MGLDLHPKAKANLGSEAEFEQIQKELKCAEGLERENLIARFQEISTPAWALLGAPVVGVDSVATVWFLAQVRKDHGIETPNSHPEQAQNEIEKQALSQMTGYCALELLPDCDGFAVYTNAYLYDGQDRTSFRGQFLHDCVHIIGEPQLEMAYNPMSSSELLSYGDAMLRIARDFSNKSDCAYLEFQKTPPDTHPPDPSAISHILFSIAKWCIYWGERGHGLEPDF